MKKPKVYTRSELEKMQATALLDLGVQELKLDGKEGIQRKKKDKKDGLIDWILEGQGRDKAKPKSKAKARELKPKDIDDEDDEEEDDDEDDEEEDDDEDDEEEDDDEDDEEEDDDEDTEEYDDEPVTNKKSAKKGAAKTVTSSSVKKNKEAIFNDTKYKSTLVKLKTGSAAATETVEIKEWAEISKGNGLTYGVSSITTLVCCNEDVEEAHALAFAISKTQALAGLKELKEEFFEEE